MFNSYQQAEEESSKLLPRFGEEEDQQDVSLASRAGADFTKAASTKSFRVVCLLFAVLSIMFSVTPSTVSRASTLRSEFSSLDSFSGTWDCPLGNSNPDGYCSVCCPAGSAAPTAMPSASPSLDPSERPSVLPTFNPSERPSVLPTLNPSERPSILPTFNPSERPSVLPTQNPSERPSVLPTVSPTRLPTASPTALLPTITPTQTPTTYTPTRVPTLTPTTVPTTTPTFTPTLSPASSVTVCGVGSGTTQEGGSVVVTCPRSDYVVRSIDFASYGTATGSCGNYVLSGCSSSTSVSYVSSVCLGLNSCTVQSLNSNFGDPCVGVNKNTKIQVTCEYMYNPTLGPTRAPTTPTIAPTRVPTLTPTILPTVTPTRIPTLTPTVLPTRLPTFIPTPTPVSGVSVCGVGTGTTQEGGSVVVSCPLSSYTIKSITFASYGTPTGSCGSYGYSSCSSGSSMSYVTSKCLGLNSCTVWSTNGNFGDPCGGVVKYTKIQVLCG